jgi:hypothetical protein
MPVHEQTITWGTHLGKPKPGIRGHWLQRIWHWLSARPESNNEAPTMTVYGDWDRRCEPFKPPQAESALEHAARRGGQSWFIALHSAAL